MPTDRIEQNKDSSGIQTPNVIAISDETQLRLSLQNIIGLIIFALGLGISIGQIIAAVKNTEDALDQVQIINRSYNETLTKIQVTQERIETTLKNSYK